MDAFLRYTRAILVCQDPVYDRVDMVQTVAGPVLMELEMIEPALHFHYGTGAAGHFAQILIRELRTRSLSR